ncbi:glycosyltransferase [Roseobacter sp. HKCCD7390]|nr:glycosyltransferase [Roseobacter sp. HKCCD7390]
MKRVNNHLKQALVSMGHDCIIDTGLNKKSNLCSWNKIVFTGGPANSTLQKIAAMRLFHWRAEFILCGLMPSISAEKRRILRWCVNKVISENPVMGQLAELNGLRHISQPAATFSYQAFLRGRDRSKPERSAGPLRVLHVGHLNERRNVFELACLCKDLGFPLTFLVSSTEKEDQNERARLEHLGATIISEYQNDLFAFYRQFDLYAFPVKRPDAAIAMPLSVIEALLSGLNVLSTDFGEVSAYFGEVDNVMITNELLGLTAEQLEVLANRPMMEIVELEKFDTLQFAKAIAGTT